MFRSLRWICVGALLLTCGTPPITMTLSSSATDCKADGSSSVTIDALILRGDAPLDRGKVTFVSALPGSSFAPIPNPASPPSGAITTSGAPTGGKVSVKLYSVKTGNAAVTATYIDDVSKATDTKEVDIKFNIGTYPVTAIDFKGADPLQVPQGETSTLTFQAKDTFGNGVPGATMTFTLDGTNTLGCTIAPPSALTDSSGNATVTLTAGTTAGTVKVDATVLSIKKTSDPITILPPAITFESLLFKCKHASIGGFQGVLPHEADHTAGQGLKMDCTVTAKDRNGQPAVGTLYFLAEAGSFTPNPVQMTNGTATTSYQTGCPFPVDVAPLGTDTDMGQLCEFYNPCTDSVENRTCNQRDGKVTLVVWTWGQEAISGWTANDPATDLTEPYVDTDDSGTWDDGTGDTPREPKADPDKPFQDSNGKQDTWTRIWKKINITWTGAPAAIDIAPGNNQTFPVCSAGAYYDVRVLDINGNIPTAFNPASDAITATCNKNCKVESISPYNDQPPVTRTRVTISDSGHTCPWVCPTPPCGSANQYSITFGIKRTLDGSGKQPSPVETFDMVNNSDQTITPDPTPRTGLFDNK